MAGEPLSINYDDPVDKILEQVMDAIEQSRQFMLRGKHHLLSRLDK